MDANKIKELRDSLGLSREEFAVRVGVSMRTVVRWETGKGKPTRLGVRALEHLRAKSSRATKRPPAK